MLLWVNQLITNKNKKLVFSVNIYNYNLTKLYGVLSIRYILHSYEIMINKKEQKMTKGKTNRYTKRPYYSLPFCCS